MKGFFKSSIGKKLIMSVTGCFLVLFLTFHMCMNLVYVFSAEGYNMVCEFLGSNWYAVAGTMVLAAGFLFHIIYATVLTLQNKKARGTDVYAEQKLHGVEWSAKNMYILGAIVCVGLLLHFIQFWSKMMAVELFECTGALPDGFKPTVAGAADLNAVAADGAAWIGFHFSKWYNVVLYLVWFAALWLHLNHGFWSMFQTIGASNSKWIPRLKTIGTVFTTILMGGFALVVLVAFFRNCCGA